MKSFHLLLSQSLIFILLVLTVSCKKNVVSTVNVGHSHSGPIPSYSFDWETSTYMPSTPANTIPMPWNSGSTAIDPGIVSDYLSASGWRLVYNTFTPTTPATGSSTPYYFTLYNQYRGLLRFYIWQPPTTTFSSYIQHGLNLYSSGTTSTMLNFDGTDIPDIATNTTTFTDIVNQQISANGGTWIAVQYEIAYDPSIALSTFPNLGLGLNAQYVNVSAISLQGTSIGTIGGTITSGGVSLTGTAQNVAKGAITAYGYSSIEAAATADNNNALLKQIGTAIGSALTGNITGVLSAVFGVFTGSNGATTSHVNLTTNATINLNGTSIQNGGLLNTKLAFPGQSNSQTADGLTPIYNNVMGVFYISAKPNVTYKSSITGINAGTGLVRYTQAWNTFTFNPNSITIVYNPAVLAVASIQNVTKQLLYIEPTPTNTLHTVNGTETSIGALYTYSGASQVTTVLGPPVPQGSAPPSAQSLVGYFAVKISFDVVPNDGTPKSTIVKTFLATATSVN